MSSNILVAYVVSQGTDHLTSITESKNFCCGLGASYNSNFDTNFVSVEEIYAGNIPKEYFLS